MNEKKFLYILDDQNLYDYKLYQQEIIDNQNEIKKLNQLNSYQRKQKGSLLREISFNNLLLGKYEESMQVAEEVYALHQEEMDIRKISDDHDLIVMIKSYIGEDNEIQALLDLTIEYNQLNKLEDKIGFNYINVAKYYERRQHYEMAYSLARIAFDKHFNRANDCDKLIISGFYTICCYKTGRSFPSKHLKEVTKRILMKVNLPLAYLIYSYIGSNYYEVQEDYEKSLEYFQNYTKYYDIYIKQRKIDKDDKSNLLIDSETLISRLINKTKEDSPTISDFKIRDIKFFKKIMNSIPLLIVALDENNRYLFFNDNYAEYFDIKSDSVVGRKIGFTNRILNFEVFDYINNYNKQNDILTNHYGLITFSDQSTRLIEYKYKPYYDKSKKYFMSLFFIRDITSANRFISKVNNLHQVISNVFSNLPIGIVVTDREFNPIICNKIVYDYLGVKDKDINHDISEIPSRIKKFYQNKLFVPKSLLTGNHYSREIEFVNYNGKRLRVQEDIYYKDEKFGSFLIVIRDITERYGQKILLSNLNNYYNSIINSSNMLSIFSVDENLRIINSNNFFKKILNSKNLEKDTDDFLIIGKSLFNDQEMQEIIANIKNNKSYKGVKRFESYFIEYNITPMIDCGNNFKGFTFFGIDITNNVMAQEELQKTNTIKNKFLSIISHDLRGPIGSINRMLQYLLDNSFELSSEEQNNILQELFDSIDNCYYLLLNLLQWSATQQDNIEEQVDTVDVVKEIKKAMNILFIMSNEKKITLELDAPEHIKLKIDIDILITIIRNLVNNAIKFTDVGGKVKIKIEKIADNNIKFSVIDTGIGIPEDMIKNLNNVKNNVSRFGTKGEKGSGLGLLLCYELLEKLGSSLDLISDLNYGSTFSFIIPVNRKYN